MGDTTPDLRDNGCPDHHSVHPATAAPDPHSQGNGRHHTNGANGLGKGSTSGSNPRVKASRSNFTVPQPFSLTTEKRASAGSKPGVNGVLPTPPKTQKIGTKSRVDISAAHQKASTPSPAGTKSTPRPNEFVFRSDERAQKRMEFYANLTEKSKAKEAEKNRIKASTQQQVAAEIKKLRKDQTFKATPMPKFYQEPAPVRIDVKKTPTTRAKSPKLGRRSSTDQGAPRIIARRSSDEYDMNVVPVPVPARVPATPDTKSTSLPRSANVGEVNAQQQVDEVGSEHSSSRKSDPMIPRAPLSEEDEEDVSMHGVSVPGSMIPRAPPSEEDEDEDVLTHGVSAPGLMIPRAPPSEEDEDEDVAHGVSGPGLMIPRAPPSEEDEDEDLSTRMIPRAAPTPESMIPRAPPSVDEDDVLAPESMVPRAPLSEDEDHVAASESMIPRAPPSVDDEEVVDRPTISVARDFEGMVHLPVSSSLLDDVDDTDDVDYVDDDELESDDEDEEFPSPSGNVRVFISEEFRQAAKATPAVDEGDTEEEEEEQGKDGKEHRETSQRVYVNNL